MLLEFPDDSASDYLDRQYMLCESLLVAPVFSHDEAVDYYVPAGRWTNILDGRLDEGLCWVHEIHDFGSLPLLVRPNSIIPLGSRTDRPDYDFADGVTLHVYAMTEGEKTVSIPTLTGMVGRTFRLRRTRSLLEVQPGGSAKPWQLILVGIGWV